MLAFMHTYTMVPVRIHSLLDADPNSFVKCSLPHCNMTVTCVIRKSNGSNESGAEVLSGAYTTNVILT